MIDCFKNIFYKEGPFAFYKGTLPPMIGAVGVNSIVFGTHEFSKNFLQ